MRYIIYIACLLLGVGAAGAQHYVGVRAGIGGGSTRQFPVKETGTVWGLKSGGVAWKHYTPQAFVGGIEIDALWMQQGWREYQTQLVSAGSDETKRIGHYQRKVDMIMVPIMWQPHLYAFRQRVRVFLNAGVTFSYVLSSSQSSVNYLTGASGGGDYPLHITRDNRVGYGLCGGGGVSWSVRRLELFAEARYYIGYSDILRNRNKYETNPLRSPLDGLQVQAGIFYRLGRGGIKSAQGNGSRSKTAVDDE